jgi:DMSO/TMAO reductase YedYZ molybdopterin-dependent catalytic subunit
MMPQPERRAVLPAHLVPAELAALDDWQLRVDGLVAQPLALSLHEIDALGAQAADCVCEEGGVAPEQP